MKVRPKTTTEIEAMRQGGRILAAVLKEVAAAVRPGVTTKELDALAEAGLRRRGATPSFLGYGDGDSPYPASLCTSVNSTVVHGIPDVTELKDGDIVGLDLGCWYQDMCTDMAVTVAVGSVDPQAKKLMRTAERALSEAVKRVRAGVSIGDIGACIQAYVEAQGFSVVRALTGHGVGQAVHEEPAVPNFGIEGQGLKLARGMTLALEPMVNEGGYDVKTLADGWTVVTKDGKRSAHWEVTVAVTDNGCEVLTKV